METIYLNTSDGVKLNGIIYKTNKSKKVVISVHGMATNCIKKREEIIAEKLNNIQVDYLIFNNRGHDIINYSNREINGNKENFLSGTAYEEFNDCYYDIIATVNYAISMGYEEIFLLGHSLGSTKIVYTYNKIIEKNKELKNRIKGIILLSLVDLPDIHKVYLGDRYKDVLKYAEKLEKENNLESIMPNKSFIYPISVRVFLRYFRDNLDIDFAQFSNEKYSFDKINNIEVPLFMRWGNIGELILQDAEYLCNFLKTKIHNQRLDIGYIDGANHSYNNKENELAGEIKNFIQKI